MSFYVSAAELAPMKTIISVRCMTSLAVLPTAMITELWMCLRHLL